MAAVSEVHAEDGIARLEQGEIRRLIGLGTRMGLDIRVFGTEQGAGALAGDLLHHVYLLAAAVIAPAGIALGVLVGQNRPHGRHNGRRNDVLRRDQLQVAALAGEFLFHRGPDLRVGVFDKPNGIHQFGVHAQIPFIHNMGISYHHFPRGCKSFSHNSGRIPCIFSRFRPGNAGPAATAPACPRTAWPGPDWWRAAFDGRLLKRDPAEPAFHTGPRRWRS